MSEKTDRFVSYLWKLDRKAFAELRRSLSDEPGRAIPAIPYVERFTLGEYAWNRQMYYLVAGLFCLVERPLEHGATPPKPVEQSFGRSVGRLYLAKEKSASTERRFIRLLGADAGQLAERLRQMTTLLHSESVPVGWSMLLNDLFYWHTDNRNIQHRWAKDFYRQEADDKTQNDKTGDDETETAQETTGGTL